MSCPYYGQYSPGTGDDDTASPDDNYYIVQTGDTLYAISRFFSVSPDDLLESNPGMEPDLIAPGQKIRIPLTMPYVNCPNGAANYVIQKGDTFYSIGKKFNIRLSALLKANPNVNPDALLIGQNICIPIIYGTYTSHIYRISLMYPYRWSRIDKDRYEGIDGFFQISAISSEAPLDKVCSNEAYHKLKPYGTHPVTDNFVLDGHQACYIIPSSDQPMEMRTQSALIIKYNTPIVIEGEIYEYLIIWTDRNHLKDIANSLEFHEE